MKIIQSFAKFDSGNPRLNGLVKPSVNQGDNKEREKLLFYSFLLSYLTLKKYYNEVTMYCNNSAQDFLVKHIPYDDVVILENENDYRFWSYYKIDVIKQTKTDFIHVDSDVFIFGDIFSNFINDRNKYSGIVQNIIPESVNYCKRYVNDFRDFVTEYKIIDPKKYDGRCYSCGVIGMKGNLKYGYVSSCETIKKGFMRSKLDDYGFIGMAVEELAFYLYFLKNNLNAYEILPYEDVLKYGEHKAANYHKYTHLYLDSKFKTKYVKLVRNKIIKEFPHALKYIETYENEIMKNSPYLKEIL